MLDALKDQLSEATGSSKWVVVAYVDIRKFSEFAAERESVEIAYYLRQTYLRLLDDHFPFADFAKPTGDGLMLVFEHQADNLQEVADRVVSSAVRAVEEFAGFHGSDEMVDFAVPENIGVGIARGAASRLESGGAILDYAGGVLNLSARLMDIARPRGIVFARFTPAILHESLASRFQADSVYLRGVAEDEPLVVFVTEEWTHVPAERRRALTNYGWKTQETDQTHKEMRDGAAQLIVDLEDEPADSDEITITAYFNLGTLKNPQERSFRVRQFSFEHHAGEPRVHLRLKEIAKVLEEVRLPLNRSVRFEIVYPVHKAMAELVTPDEVIGGQ